MPNFSLTAAAVDDIENILEFGIMTFGRDQAWRYRLELERVFMLLANNPMVGRVAFPQRPDIRRHEHGRHAIFYQGNNEGAGIIGVIHMSSIRMPGDPR